MQRGPGELLCRFGQPQPELVGRVGDDGRPASAELDQPLVAQLLVAAQDGVQIDAEGGGHGAAEGSRSPGAAAPEASAARTEAAT